VTNRDTSEPGHPPRLLLHEITRKEAAQRAVNALVVLPVGATEQHGPHLPLGTDFLIVEHITRAAAQETRPHVDVLVAPTFPLAPLITISHLAAPSHSPQSGTTVH
jgi:creatinine amidohydrolase/Fe(II)-dependent formamide hydrolase-like protein